MTAKKVTKKVTELIEKEITVSFMSVEQDGYKAIFHNEDQKNLVAYLLAKVDGYAAMTRTLAKAIDLINQRKT